MATAAGRQRGGAGAWAISRDAGSSAGQTQQQAVQGALTSPRCRPPHRRRRAPEPAAAATAAPTGHHARAHAPCATCSVPGGGSGRRAGESWPKTRSSRGCLQGGGTWCRGGAAGLWRVRGMRGGAGAQAEIDTGRGMGGPISSWPQQGARAKPPRPRSPRSARGPSNARRFRSMRRPEGQRMAEGGARQSPLSRRLARGSAALASACGPSPLPLLPATGAHAQFRE